MERTRSRLLTILAAALLALSAAFATLGAQAALADETDDPMHVHILYYPGEGTSLSGAEFVQEDFDCEPEDPEFPGYGFYLGNYPSDVFAPPEGMAFLSWSVAVEEQELGTYAAGSFVPLERLGDDVYAHATATYVDSSIPLTVTVDPGEGGGEQVALDVERGGSFAVGSPDEYGFSAPEGQVFVCWALGEATLQPGDVIESVTSDLTLAALWSETRVVTLSPGVGGGDALPLTLLYGDTFVIGAPEDYGFVAPEGYMFDAWLDEGIGVRWDPGTELGPVNFNVTITALWKPLITVELAPGESFILEYIQGEPLFAPEGGLDEGDEDLGQLGWRVRDALGNDLGFFLPGELMFDAVTQPLFLEAERRCTVSFRPNGGSGTMASRDYFQGESVRAPDCGYTAPEGKTFAGWAINNGRIIWPGEWFTVSYNTALYAQWGDVNYVTVTTALGESFILEFAQGEPLFAPEEGLGEGDEGSGQLGWIVRDALGNDLGFFLPGELVFDSVTQPLFLEAARKCIVRFDANGGTGSMDRLFVEKGNVLYLPGCGFSAPGGKRFVGWKISGQIGVHPAGGAINVNSDMTLEAQWGDITYATVTLDPGDAGGDKYLFQIETGNSFVIGGPEKYQFFAPDGYAFDAWLDGGIGVRWQPGRSLGPVDRDVTFTALWKPLVIVTMAPGESFPLEYLPGDPFFAPTEGLGEGSNGAKLLGWRVCDALGNDLGFFLPGELVFDAVTQPLFLEAVWGYPVTFDAGGGGGEMPGQLVAAGDEYVVPACAFRAPAGMGFSAWKIGGAMGTLSPGDVVTVNDPLELTALWVPSIPKTGDQTSSALPVALAGGALLAGAGMGALLARRVRRG